MNSQLLIIKNITHEGPGLLEPLLHTHGISADVVDLSQGETFPDPQNYRAVVVLGGPQSANAATPAMQHQLKQIEQIVAEGIPYLGICLGMQLLVKAAGGMVLPCPQKETGFFDADGAPYAIELTNAGKNDPIFAGLDDTIHVFQLHGETVELAPSGMELLATGAHCRHQAVKVGANAYGLQCHFELTRAMFADWQTIDYDLKQMDSTQFLADFEAFREAYSATGNQLLHNFLTIARLA
jgi:GMP synthase-like glutamine amidotransferase